jgi:hypothetical protein
MQANSPTCSSRAASTAPFAVHAADDGKRAKSWISKLATHVPAPPREGVSGEERGARSRGA